MLLVIEQCLRATAVYRSAHLVLRAGRDYLRFTYEETEAPYWGRK